MTNPALLMLLERLLWPIPRVRWEAARSLASLIREEDRKAAIGLLQWIGARRLESEVVIGLGIIDAFDLGTHFEFAEVSDAVRAPSHLSDWILKRNFTDANGLSPFRYSVSPSEPATLPPDEETWFDRYRKSAVPPVFTTVLTRLQESTGFPFRKRWKHEWRWLQATNPRSETGFPYFFTGADRERVGQLDRGQRELYVSAFLRTLAYFAIHGPINHEVAEDYSLLALTMNRGLADVEPVSRPDWARNLLPCDARRTKELARRLWASAEANVIPGEVPLALRVVDHDTNTFVEFDVMLTMGRFGSTVGLAEAETLDLLIANDLPGEMAGLVARNEGINPFPIKHPLAMTQCVLPEILGRVHIDLAFNIRLGAPVVLGTSANVVCSPSDVRLEWGGEILSRWVHWYADWEPTAFPELESAVGSITTVSKSILDKLRASHGLKIARLVKVRRAARSEIYREFKVETEAYWA